MYDLGSSQLPTSFDPATDSDQHSLREFIDLVADAGYVVDSDEHGDDPELIAPDGSAVETWHEDYPYPNLMDRREYETQKRLLQIELLKLQYSIDDTGERHVIIFEGRDAAGKGGAIKRFSEHLNPRRCRVVALDKPSDRELGQWNFQRYIQHLLRPAKSCSLTARGIIVAASNGSWGFAPMKSIESSFGRLQSSKR